VKRLLVATLAVAASIQIARAQTRFSYSSGQELSPAYEGWMQNSDGSFTMYFGYMNTNWLQQFDIAPGPENDIEPGGPDQGQPTHFYPRRNPFLFTIKVPKDFGKKELIWTLTANGKTNHAYASLKSDYEIDKQVISTEVGGDNGSLRDELRDNIPPDLKVEGSLQRTVKVGQPLDLAVIAGDPDNLPARRDGRLPPGMKVPPPGNGRPPAPAGAARGAAPQGGRGAAPEGAAASPQAPASGSSAGSGPGAGQAAGGAARGAGGAGRGAAAAAAATPRPPVSVVASSGPGLRFAWSVYRGKEASVTFTPDQMKTWMDTRAYGNSPWSPPYTIPVPPADGRWVAQATFKEPGTYVLRGIASDGSLFTYENVTVTVTP
jgi:hypothetical protein